MLITNGETINNQKDAKDLVDAYLLSKNLPDNVDVTMTRQGCRYDCDISVGGQVKYKTELKFRHDNVTKYSDYKIETDKVNWLHTNITDTPATITVADTTNNTMYMGTISQFTDPSTSWIKHNDKFPRDNDNRRFEYKETDGTHIKWTTMRKKQAKHLDRYYDLLNIATTHYGCNADYIVERFDDIIP